MKIAACIFSWLGGVLTTIVWLIALLEPATLTVYFLDYYYSEPLSVGPGTWAVFWVFLVGRIAILVWREIATRHGRKVGCGVCTIIFCSVVGGILTLCIPIDQLYVFPKSTPSSSTTSSSNVLLKQERIELNRSLLMNGVITQEEFDRRVAEINTKFDSETPEPQPATLETPLTEQQKIDLIQQYKKMYDEGIITLEEFEAKKKELLK